MFLRTLRSRSLRAATVLCRANQTCAPRALEFASPENNPQRQSDAMRRGGVPVPGPADRRSRKIWTCRLQRTAMASRLQRLQHREEQQALEQIDRKTDAAFLRRHNARQAERNQQ